VKTLAIRHCTSKKSGDIVPRALDSNTERWQLKSRMGSFGSGLETIRNMIGYSTRKLPTIATEQGGQPERRIGSVQKSTVLGRRRVTLDVRTTGLDGASGF
jgi:hypothetical protein